MILLGLNVCGVYGVDEVAHNDTMKAEDTALFLKRLPFVGASN